MTNQQNTLKRDELVKVGIFAKSNEQISTVALGIKALAESEGGDVLCGTVEVRDMFVQMGETATSVEAKVNIAYAITKVVEGALPAQEKFSTDEMRDMLLQIGESASNISNQADSDSDQIRANVSGAIANLCDGNATGQNMFNTHRVVDMFSAMGGAARLDNSRKWIANGVASIIENNPVVRQGFATPAIVTMLTDMGCDATSLDAIISITRTIGILIQHDAKTTVLFKTPVVEGMLLSMWEKVGSGQQPADDVCKVEPAKNNIASLMLTLNMGRK